MIITIILLIMTIIMLMVVMIIIVIITQIRNKQSHKGGVLMGASDPV